ncbi:MAG: hypothetical protein AAFR81_16915 [Chloroflexota bacterium]
MNFDFYDNAEPVLTTGAAGAWDSVQVWGAQIVEHDGLLYMFYIGNSSSGIMNTAIGYATSTDGYTWEKAAANPIFQDSFANEYQAYPIPVSLGRVLVDTDGTWVMYYTTPNLAWGMPTQAIYRATAPSPDGPWTPDEGIALEGGERGSWDYQIATQAVFIVDGEYRLYYTGFEGRNERDESAWSFPQLGLATSDDGITFERNEDPVLPLLPDSDWQSEGVTSQTIRQTEDGWEMFYVGHPRPIYTFPNPANSTLKIGYATSSDGINWTRQGSEPIADTGETGYPLLGMTRIDDTYLLYYDAGWGQGISVLEGTLEN